MSQTSKFSLSVLEAITINCQPSHCCNANHRKIKFSSVPDLIFTTPQPYIQGKWQPCWEHSILWVMCLRNHSTVNSYASGFSSITWSIFRASILHKSVQVQAQQDKLLLYLHHHLCVYLRQKNSRSVTKVLAQCRNQTARRSDMTWQHRRRNLLHLHAEPWAIVNVESKQELM